MFGGTIVGANLFLQGCGSEEAAASSESIGTLRLLTEEQVALLDEVGETILPTTASSPGAKASDIGRFMDVIVGDCYTDEEQKVFFQGIDQLQAAAQAAHQKGFLQLDAAERMALLHDIDEEAKAYDLTLEEQKAARAIDRRLPPVLPHYFTMMKQLTIWGFFTSEVGATQARRYIEVPGKYDGDVPYQKGDRAWAT